MKKLFSFLESEMITSRIKLISGLSLIILDNYGSKISRELLPLG